MVKTTRPQRKAIKRVFDRHEIKGSYLTFRRTVLPAPFDNCLMVHLPSANIWLGIETDGYTHS